MERMVLKASAQDHVNAYLEYRMIVGDSGEKEYAKRRKKYYAAKKKKGFTVIRTGNVKRYNGLKQIKRKSGYKTGDQLHITPLELFQTKPKWKDYSDESEGDLEEEDEEFETEAKGKLYFSISSSSGKQVKKQKRKKEVAKKKKTLTLKQIMQIDDLEERIPELELLLQSKLTKMQRYGANKQLKVAKSRVKRERMKERKKMDNMTEDVYGKKNANKQNNRLLSKNIFP